MQRTNKQRLGACACCRPAHFLRLSSSRYPPICLFPTPSPFPECRSYGSTTPRARSVESKVTGRSCRHGQGDAGAAPVVCQGVAARLHNNHRASSLTCLFWSYFSFSTPESLLKVTRKIMPACPPPLPVFSFPGSRARWFRCASTTPHRKQGNEGERMERQRARKGAPAWGTC